jgi:ubiquinone/menaquinone biosynthesis C-methylase UbiE
MNRVHLELCSSEAWADAVRRYIIPGALAGAELGDNVLEVGPGPGRTTDVLREMLPRLTALEIDDGLARQLAARLAGGNVDVVRGDATALPFSDRRFSAVVSFTMLHHVPTIALQDRLFAEVARVLRRGGTFHGVDSKDSEDFRALHIDDICVPLEPATLAARLLATGFGAVRLDDNPYVTQFHASV